MGSTQGEIRIGPSHQAKLPINRSLSNNECLSPDPEFSIEREDVRWVPRVTLDGDLFMYVRAARSIAAFAGMCDGTSADDGCNAAVKDETTFNALDVLHDSGYDRTKALQALVKCPVPKSLQQKWSDEEQKRFVKGLRQFGKNFFKIKKELLPHKETPELVEYYYLWKKSPAAGNNRPHRRRRGGSSRRSRNTRGSRGGTPKEEVLNTPRPSPSGKELGEASSASDEENDNSYDDSDSRENGGYRCSHCFTTSSRDWSHALSGPKEGSLLCYNCRSYYKQFSELPPTPINDSYVFKPVQTDSPEGSPGRMKTRNNKGGDTPTKEKPINTKSTTAKRNEGTRTPEPSENVSTDKKTFKSFECKSPVSSSVTPLGDKAKNKTAMNSPSRKRKASNSLDGDVKKKREHGPESGSDVEEDEDENKSLKSLGEEEQKSPSENEKSTSIQVDTPVTPHPISDTQVEEIEPDKCNISETIIENDKNIEIHVNESGTLSSTSEELLSTINSVEIKEETTDVSSDALAPIDENASVPIVMTDTDENLPPVLTSEESYVPKDTMPTLQAIAPPPIITIAGTGTITTMTTSLQPTSHTSPLQMPIDEIKTEPQQVSSEENSMSAETAQKPTTQSDIKPSQTLVDSPPKSMSTFNHNIPSQSPSTVQSDDFNSKHPIPSYPIYNDIERNDKNVGPTSVNLPPNIIRYSQYQPYSISTDRPENYYLDHSVQMEPQDLKIKQETLPSVDPLQSLKEVKVPGYSKSPVSQVMPPSVPLVEAQNNSHRMPSPYPLNIQTELIKKENDVVPLKPSSTSPSISNTSASKSVLETSKSSVPISPKQSHGPLVSPHPIPVSSTAAHPTQQPSPVSRVSPAQLPTHMYMSNPPQFLPPYLIPGATPHGPYSHPAFATYPYAAFPYHYPIPQPIPPPRPGDVVKREPSENSSTMMTSHHSSSSSSSVTTRSVRDEDTNLCSQEITQTHRRSSSHHSSIHHHNEKQTISHSSSSSSSVQHKVKRSSSPQHHTSASCHVSATHSQTTSSSVSTNHGQSTHHSHHHQHTHQHHHQAASSERVSPLMAMSGLPPLGSGPVIPQHHGVIGIGSLSSTGHLDVLRAHAQAASMNAPMLQPSLGHAPDEEESPSPTTHIPRGPSPEPKIEDSECHRSQSAIFLRHWNRGDFNSCARTDLTFKPVPDSKLDRKRQERIRKQSEREREERERRKIMQSEKVELPKPPSRGPIETITSPYDRFTRASPCAADTPALRQLSEYARPHAAFSPVAVSRASSMTLPPHGVDPMLHHYPMNMYGVGSVIPRERMELERSQMEQYEREKQREREIREKEQHMINERIKEELIKSSAATAGRIPLEHQWLDLQRRFSALTPTGIPGAAPPPPGALHPAAAYGLYGNPAQAAALNPIERDRIERLNMAALQRQSIMAVRDPTLGLHPAELLSARPYADQFVHQVAHEQMQRQLLLDRERYGHPVLAAQAQEEYMRQREREMKVRALEEAARAGRP